MSSISTGFRPGITRRVVAQVALAAHLELDDFLERLEADEKVLILLLDEIPGSARTSVRSYARPDFSASRRRSFRNGAAPPSERPRSGRLPVPPSTCPRFAWDEPHVQTIDRLKEAGFEVLGADMSGEPLWSYR